MNELFLEVELKMTSEEAGPLRMFGSSIVVGGQVFHAATLTTASKRSAAAAALDEVMEDLIITGAAKPKPLVWGGAVEKLGVTLKLSDYWRVPIRQERVAVADQARKLNVGAIGACWTIGAAATGISARRFARHRSWADASPFAQDAEWATVAKRLIGFTTKRLSGISRLAA